MYAFVLLQIPFMQSNERAVVNLPLKWLRKLFSVIPFFKDIIPVSSPLYYLQTICAMRVTISYMARHGPVMHTRSGAMLVKPSIMCFDSMCFFYRTILWKLWNCVVCPLPYIFHDLPCFAGIIGGTTYSASVVNQWIRIVTVSRNWELK